MSNGNECQSIANEISGLEAEKRSLQEDLQTASPQQKPGIVNQIKKINIKIENVEKRLATCLEGSDTITFDLPFRGEDLNPGIRIYNRKVIHTEDPNHEQHFGFDLTALRLDVGEDRWTSNIEGTSGSRNADKVIYGMPVYAAASGIIRRGWRNAPENPRPKRSSDTEDGQEWLHPERIAGNIASGGNFLQLELGDGSFIRYSHFRPGSIPEALCPHNASLLPNGNLTDTNIAPADQVRVRAGQFLGVVGNAGNSTGPHLHFHRWRNGNPVLMRFRRGLSTPVVDGKADINAWTRFAGRNIPAGPVLIWPPRTVRQEYARHGFPSSQFERMFHHLADSGYWLKWLDGYTVGDDRFFNFVWSPAPGKWRGHWGQSSAEHDRRVEDAKNDGLAPVFVANYLGAEGVRYAAVFQEGKPGNWSARHGLSEEQHEEHLEKAKAKGLFPVCVSVVSISDKRSYTVLYRSDPIGSYVINSRIKESEYQRVFDENDGVGRRPICLKAYMHRGQPYLSAIFASSGKNVHARHGLSSTEYQKEYNSAQKINLLTQVVTSFDGAQSQHRFAAIWR